MKLKQEVFGDDNALGERVPDRRPSVPGHRGDGAEGPVLQLDLDDTAFVPVSEAMRLFNRDDLIEMTSSTGTSPPRTPSSATSAAC